MYCMKHPIEGEMDGRGARGISCRGREGGGGRGGSLLQGDEPSYIEKNTRWKNPYINESLTNCVSLVMYKVHPRSN
jgi:hypothetical protein